MKWMCVLVVFTLTGIASIARADGDELRLLSKQVGALMERRNEDVRNIEDSLRRSLMDSPEIRDIKEEVVKLRAQLSALQGPTPDSPPTTPPPNARLTLAYVSSGLEETRREIGELQTALNASELLQHRALVEGRLGLLRGDVDGAYRELETMRASRERADVRLGAVTEEASSAAVQAREALGRCGRLEEQLKVLQIEWSHNMKLFNTQLNNKNLPGDQQTPPHPSRHSQKLLKKHILELDKNSRKLQEENNSLRSRLSKLEKEMQILQNGMRIRDEPTETLERINGNEIEDYIKRQQLIELPRNINEKLARIQKAQKMDRLTITNITKQLTNFDKLHMSMLELLENVESIENKIEVTFPEFRKEVSKLEMQIAETNSQLSSLKEDQTNTKNSVKAISVSVSNLQDKAEKERARIGDVEDKVEKLMLSSSMQTSKLHDHILKSESSTMDLNSTKSTIHLVQELKSFENEYKSIINKLPQDCSAVSGPPGLYLISPGAGEPILAACSNGWTTVQKRYDGTVDFNRNWNDYSNGFGSATGEHWLGNRNLHYLTRDNCTRLQISMKDIYGKYWQATYDDFRVADYSQGFRLDVGGYIGNASDALDYQNRMEFSTIDNDRDISNTHCASNYEGGWWFSHCQHANLNGRYNLGLTWFDSSRNEWIAVSQSEMRIKPREKC